MSDVELNPSELDIQYSAQDVQDLTESFVLNKGLHSFLIIESTAKVSEKSQRLMLQLRCAPMKVVGNPESADINNARYFFLVLPHRNPGAGAPENEMRERQTRQTIARMCEGNLRAILGNDAAAGGIPDRPRKDEAGRYVFKGQPIDASQYNKCVAEVMTIVLQRGMELFKNAGQLIDFAFIGEVAYEMYQDRPRDKIDRMHLELPVKDGVRLSYVPADQMLIPESMAVVEEKKRGR